MGDPLENHPVVRAALAKNLTVAVGRPAALPVPDALPAGITEREFAKEVIRLARANGWRVAHFRPARVRRNGVEKYETPVGADGKGWPDLVLVRGGEIVFAELKAARGKAGPGQVGWLDALRATGAAAGFWFPTDWPDIVRVLAAG